MRNKLQGLRPAKYTDMIPYSHIFMSGLMDFGKSSFTDFSEMEAERRVSKFTESISKMINCSTLSRNAISN